MFEAQFKTIALVESNAQGQQVFRVTEQEAHLDETGFLSFLTAVYQQGVRPILRAGDPLTITMHLDVPPRELERAVRFREDGQFEGEGLQAPNSDLLPLVRGQYIQFLQQVVPGDVFTVTFRVQRL
jgi:hypothetical protein